MVSHGKSTVHLVTEKWREGGRDLVRDGWYKPARGKVLESVSERCENKVECKCTT